MLLKRSIKRLYVFLGILSLISVIVAQENQQKPDVESSVTPNIVIILADDFGYGSLNSYGADKELLRTPHIDKITDEGIRFTNASTPSSICSPTRYGLLTGRYPWRSSLKYGATAPLGDLLPNTERTTIAKWLKERGYNTSAIGKWHLGYGQGNNEDPLAFTKTLTPGPLDLGFDYHFGVPSNHDDKWGVYVENDHIYGLRSDKIHPYSRSFYREQYIGYDAPQRVNNEVMEVLTGKATDWIKQQSSDNPFFMYFAPVAVHHPITPSEYMYGMSDCGPYGDFIQDIDLSVGRILETLEYMNLSDNTIIIFTSDNGGSIPKSPIYPENKAVEYGFKINGDLRGSKTLIYEGGTRVPLIVSWPGKVKEGSVSEDLVNLVDIFATVCDITDGNLPESKDVAPDSYSFLPSLLDKTNANARTSMVTADALGMHALLDGNWKYIDDTPPEGLPESRLEKLKDFKPQLYNLEEDPGETMDLYDKNPEMVKKLRNKLNKIREADFTR